MDISNMKNMGVLKNLPSNLIEEAIVILKTNKEAKKLEFIENNNKIKNENKTQNKGNNYIVKEAEIVLENYISKLEKKEGNAKEIKLKEKYEKLKKYSIIVSIILFISLLNNFI